MHAIAETEFFTKRVKSLRISIEVLADITTTIAANPGIGVNLGGGLFKVRIARKGEGKSAGYRTVYFYKHEDMPIYLLTIFAKNEKSNISVKEKTDLKALGDLLVQHYRSRI